MVWYGPGGSTCYNELAVRSELRGPRVRLAVCSVVLSASLPELHRQTPIHEEAECECDTPMLHEEAGASSQVRPSGE
jgi:hypothetical protein